MGIGEEDEEGSSSALSLSNHTDTLGGSKKFGRRRCGGININMPLPNDEEKVDYNDNKDGMITGDVDSLLSADCRTTSQQAAKEGPAAAESRLVAADRRGGAPHHHHHHHPLNDNDFVTRKVDATKLKDVVSTNNLLGREDDARTEETQQGDDGGVPATTADVGEEESISSTSQPSCATSQSCEDHDDDDNGGEDHHSSEHQNDDAEEHTNNNLDKKNHHRHGEEEYQHRLDVAPTTFPQHLMDAIEQESQLDKPCILEWVEGGDAFLIRDKLAFERTVLPKYFSKNCKCKFISFVRKLYRWGFRQDKKLSPVGMTFAHPHFIRGDKQRCLLMRSIVKKPVLLRQLASDGISSTAHVPPRFHPATINNSLVQHHHPLGLNTLGHQQQSYGMINMAHQQVANLPALSPLLAQLNQGQGLYPANGFIRRGGNDGTTITPPPSSYWAPSSLQLHSTVPNPFSATSSAPVAFKPTMQNDLETLHRQRQQELLPQILSGIHDGTRIGSYNQALLSSIQPAAAAAAVGYHHGIDTVGRLASTTPGSFNVAVVTLASQMMKSDPSMEPWRAIELAKMCLPEPGTFGSLP